jgi:ankyrin repeat protein
MTNQPVPGPAIIDQHPLATEERDSKVLVWIVKPLADDTELEPFVEAIPDLLWGPTDRCYPYEPHIPYYGNPLETASEQGHMEIVHILLKKGAKISGMALQIASREGHIQIVCLLLENRTDVNEVGRTWDSLETPLSCLQRGPH